MTPGARQAFSSAFAAARSAGLQPVVRSGWRDAATQQRLFDDAVRRYGSRDKALDWVLPPERSSHVRGIAVDLRPLAVAQWLERHGATYGICRRFANEWWHFEYLGTSSCPALLPSARYA
jgi:zinc D-Ala-D-Ala carboxypeptidase